MNALIRLSCVALILVEARRSSFPGIDCIFGRPESKQSKRSNGSMLRRSRDIYGHFSLADLYLSTPLKDFCKGRKLEAPSTKVNQKRNAQLS